MSDRIRAYGYMEPVNGAQLPADVYTAMDAPTRVSMIVFATSPREAWERLGQLDMAPSGPHHLIAYVGGLRVRALTNVGLNQLRAVYAADHSDDRVYVIAQPASHRERIAAYIGYTDGERFVSAAAERAEAAAAESEPVVTDAMIDAALGEFPDALVYRAAACVGAAIAAALKAQVTP